MRKPQRRTSSPRPSCATHRIDFSGSRLTDGSSGYGFDRFFVVKEATGVLHRVFSNISGFQRFSSMCLSANGCIRTLTAFQHRFQSV